LPYGDLLQALDISNVRELEDLIIDAIYLDLLHGKLDQKEEQLEVTYTMGRDLEPGKLEQILAALEDWWVHAFHRCLAEDFLLLRILGRR
jgi:COP9 signalosome complex subunit 7